MGVDGGLNAFWTPSTVRLLTIAIVPDRALVRPSDATIAGPPRVAGSGLDVKRDRRSAAGSPRHSARHHYSV